MGKPKEVILVIADISGYTNFMVSNQDTLGHAHIVINELLKTIIRGIKIPLKVAKLEGDAVFLYAMRSGNNNDWEERKWKIRSKLFSFFGAFRAKAIELQHSGACACGACANVDRLRLKAVVHSGEAIRARLDGREELTGVDVITIHRLLKNSVKSHEYIMITDSAFQVLGYQPGELPVTDSIEKYDDIGEVRVKVNFPFGATMTGLEESTPLPASEKERIKYSSRFYRFKNMFPKMMRMMALAMGLKKEGKYRNLPEIPGK